MPLIACLGWGSLIWDPRELPVQREWFSDGPFIPVDFLRQSSDGRMTLVLDTSASLVRSLWTVMDTPVLAEAVAALRKREGIAEKNVANYLGNWSRGDAAPKLIADLPQWALSRGIEAAIWTALPAKFGQEDGRVATIEEVTSYLKGLTGRTRDEAERYIRYAPRQIDTLYRRKIEAALGWTPSEPPLPSYR